MRKILWIALAMLGTTAAVVVAFEALGGAEPRIPEPPQPEPVTQEDTERESIAAEYARRQQERRAEHEKRRQEIEARTKAEIERMKSQPKRPRRKVRRFRWGAAPAEDPGTALDLPEEESEAATLTAFLRICIAEADGSPQDCVGIWQSLRNIRRRACERGAVRRITECDEDGETMLSVLRRGQPHIMAVKGYELRNARAGWIRNLETDCEMPEGYLAYARRQDKRVTEEDALNRWDAQYGSRRCPYAVQLGKALMNGDDLRSVSRPGHRLQWLPGRPITWGGRCETKKASCDDRVACARGLSRITSGPKTHNAFWRRPANEGEVDPVCKALGYGHLHEGGEEG